MIPVFDAPIKEARRSLPEGKIVAIGNGLFARTSGRPGRYQEYLQKQRTCAHAGRDPRGMCYRCGARS